MSRCSSAKALAAVVGVGDPEVGAQLAVTRGVVAEVVVGHRDPTLVVDVHHGRERVDVARRVVHHDRCPPRPSAVGRAGQQDVVGCPTVEPRVHPHGVHVAAGRRGAVVDGEVGDDVAGPNPGVGLLVLDLADEQPVHQRLPTTPGLTVIGRPDHRDGVAVGAVSVAGRADQVEAHDQRSVGKDLHLVADRLGLRTTVGIHLARGLPGLPAVRRPGEPGGGLEGCCVLVAGGRGSLAGAHDALPRGVDEVRVRGVRGQCLLVVEVVADCSGVVVAQDARSAPAGAVVVGVRGEDRVAGRGVVEADGDGVQAAVRAERQPRVGGSLVAAGLPRPLGAPGERDRAVLPGGAAVRGVAHHSAVRPAVVPAVLLPGSHDVVRVRRVHREMGLHLGVGVVDAVGRGFPCPAAPSRVGSGAGGCRGRTQGQWRGLGGGRHQDRDQGGREGDQPTT